MKCSDVERTDMIYVKFFCFEVKWSEVKWVTVKFLGTKVPRTLGWPYTEGTWLYCDYFIWCVSCTVVVLTCTVVTLYCFVMCVCFGNICTCIYCLKFRGPCIVSIFVLIYFQRDVTLHSLFISGKLLYMFRVITSPIIRSTYNCIYSSGTC